MPADAARLAEAVGLLMEARGDLGQPHWRIFDGGVVAKCHPLCLGCRIDRFLGAASSPPAPENEASEISQETEGGNCLCGHQRASHDTKGACCMHLCKCNSFTAPSRPVTASRCPTCWGRTRELRLAVEVGIPDGTVFCRDPWHDTQPAPAPSAQTTPDARKVVEAAERVVDTYETAFCTVSPLCMEALRAAVRAFRDAEGGTQAGA